MNLRKMIKEQIAKLKEEDYPKITPDEFDSLPSISPRRKNVTYSREGVLSANKRITAIVAEYLKKNPEVTSTDFNSSVIERYIATRLSGNSFFTALPAIEKKYKSVETYLGYLIYHLRNEK